MLGHWDIDGAAQDKGSLTPSKYSTYPPDTGYIGASTPSILRSEVLTSLTLGAPHPPTTGTDTLLPPPLTPYLKKDCGNIPKTQSNVFEFELILEDELKELGYFLTGR